MSTDELAAACSGSGSYCCPLCLTYYETVDEKNTCMDVRHGYTTLSITMDPLSPRYKHLYGGAQ